MPTSPRPSPPVNGRRGGVGAPSGGSDRRVLVSRGNHTRIALAHGVGYHAGMNDLPIAAGLRPNLPEYTVSELAFALKRSIEENFSFVRVRGEISGFKRHGSGHCYLALKDAEAVLDAVCWRTTAIRLPLKPEDGMEVICTGRLTTYPGRSKYQLVIDTIALAGVRALLEIL